MIKKFIDWLIKPLTDEQVVDCSEQDQDEAVSEEEVKKEDKLFRPQSFDQYIGQEKAKALIKAYIEGTKKLNKTFPHVLIHGTAGCGKTTLARIIANELHKNFKEVIGIDDPTWVCYFIQDLEGGVIFIDEIHKVKRSVCEELYPAMEDYRVDGEETPFTLIGATTEIGEIIKTRKPFIDRFKIKIELEDYAASDIEKIIKQYKEKTFPAIELNENVYTVLSYNARVTPRTAISLLETTVYLGGDVEKALEASNIIYDGFTRKDLQVLEILVDYQTGAGLNTLISHLGTSEDNYLYELEPYLLKSGVLRRASKGRVITEKGKATLELLRSKCEKR
jgi:holliday junction DNA helicase RuvB